MDQPMNNPKCPTCGHIHPDGMGLAMCFCNDCSLIYHREPTLLAREYMERRDELLRRIKENEDGE